MKEHTECIVLYNYFTYNTGIIILNVFRSCSSEEEEEEEKELEETDDGYHMYQVK